MGIDTVIGGAQILSAVQTLVSRETDPLDSVALTIGHFEAGRARNVRDDHPSMILPSREIVTTCHGINFPLFLSAISAAR